MVNHPNRNKLTVRLTKPQLDAVLACISFVQAGEWPFDDAVRPETLERAATALVNAR